MSRAVSVASNYLGASNLITATTVPLGVVQPQGIASVAFPSKSVGVAVGAAIGRTGTCTTLNTPNCYIPYPANAASENAFTSVFPIYNLAAASTIPSILLSYDGAFSWAQATGELSLISLNPIQVPFLLVCL